MNAHYPEIDLETGTKKMFEDGRSPPRCLPSSVKVKGTRAGNGNAAVLGATDWLCLAAAPTFAVMALLTGVLGAGSPDMLCSAAPDASPLNRMALMYLLMSAFHSAPWLKLISRSRISSAGELRRTAA